MTAQRRRKPKRQPRNRWQRPSDVPLVYTLMAAARSTTSKRVFETRWRRQRWLVAVEHSPTQSKPRRYKILIGRYHIVARDPEQAKATWVQANNLEHAAQLATYVEAAL